MYFETLTIYGKQAQGHQFGPDSGRDCHRSGKPVGMGMVVDFGTLRHTMYRNCGIAVVNIPIYSHFSHLFKSLLLF